MGEPRHVRISKLLAFALRHRPDALGLVLDEAGWVDVDALIEGLAARGRGVSRAELEAIVAASDKQRFALSDDGRRIRANQGHSVDVELGLPPATPPGVLYHGTVDRFLEAILDEGLVPGERRHVHLSATVDVARAVGARRGKPVILEVRAAEMAADGHVFHVSANGVWLTAYVAPRYLRRA